MNVNEHERLPNFTLKIKLLHFLVRVVFNNKNTSYPKMCVKRLQGLQLMFYLMD
jgi:hypothetical protein